ncbi:MAG: ABC transporter permease [Bryobacteraceae bacterium]
MWPFYDKAKEREMREELDALAEIAGRRELGSLMLAAENARAEWRWTWLSNLAWDVRYAIRGLVRDRAFTLVAVLSIGLGVGANSAIFSLVDQALFRLLPVREPERLVLLNWSGTPIASGWGTTNLLSYPLYRDLSAESGVFDGLIARHPTRVQLTMSGAAEEVNADIVSGTYFRVLGVIPALGRLLDESDDVRPGEHPFVVVSHDFWKNRLGGASDVIGRKVLVNTFPMTVVGVAADGFRGLDWGEVPAVWIPTMMKKQATPSFDWLDDRRGRWVHIFGRLKPGLTAEMAQTGLQPWFKAMLEADTKRPGWPQVTPEQLKRYFASTLEVLPAGQGRSDMGRQLESPLLVLLAATALILLLACLNIANLCLARGYSRRRETAIRMSLGASGRRLLQGMLIQSGLLAAGGAMLGLLLVPLVARALISFLPNDVALTGGVNLQVLLFSMAAAVGTSFLFGLAPAIHASRTKPGAAMKEESGGVAGGIGLRKTLVTGQIALALVLLIGAGLFVRTLAALKSQGPGFNVTNLLRFQIEPVKSGHTGLHAKRLTQEILESVRRIPEVRSAGLSFQELLTGYGWNQRIMIQDGERRVTDGGIYCNGISPGFLETLGVPILAGRGFDDRDMHDKADVRFRSAIVNETFARRYFGERSPLGVRLGLGSAPDTRADIEIVGVMGPFRYLGLRTLDEQVVFPAFEGMNSGGTIWVRSNIPSESAFPSIREAVRRVDPNLPVKALRTVDDQLDQSLLKERMLATLASAFAGLAILLAVLGLYGVIAFVVTRRTREIGIRLALGSSRGGAIRLILRDAFVMLGLGVAIAIPAVWGVGRLVENQLFGVRPMDGATIAGAIMVVVLAGLGASLIPARRAVMRSVTETLRYE